MKKILVVGSNFAGFQAALDLKKQLGSGHDITVISKSDKFLFMPSLIWVPFGLRNREDITFPLKPIYKKKGIRFVQADVTKIDPKARQLAHSGGSESYDYLVLATGPVNDFAAVPGLGPYEGHTQSLFGLEDAERARDAFEKYFLATRKRGWV